MGQGFDGLFTRLRHFLAVLPIRLSSVFIQVRSERVLVHPLQLPLPLLLEENEIVADRPQPDGFIMTSRHDRLARTTDRHRPDFAVMTL